MFAASPAKTTSAPKFEVPSTSIELLNVDKPTTFHPLLSVMSVLTPVLELIVNVSV